MPIYVGDKFVNKVYSGDKEVVKVYLNGVVTYIRAADITAYESAMFNLSPVRYWPFNEGSGTSAADLISDQNGTINDSSTWAAEPSEYPGFGPYLESHGPGDYSLTPIPTDLTTKNQVTVVWTVNTTESFMVDAWAGGMEQSKLISNDPVPGDPIILFEYNGDSALGDNTDRLGVTFGLFFQHMVTGYVDAPTVNWRDGNWHLIVCTMDIANKQVKMWIDGVSQTVGYIDYPTVSGGAIDSNVTPYSNSGAFLIGPGHTTDEVFNSGSNHLAIFDRELTQTEINNLWSSFPAKAPEPEPSVFFSAYNFDEASGLTFLDSSGNSRNVTIPSTDRRTDTFNKYGGHAAKNGAVLAGGTSGVSVADYNALSSRTMMGWMSYYVMNGSWIMRWQNVAANSGVFGIYLSGSTLNARVKKGGVNYNASFTPVSPVVNTWYHVAQTYDATSGLITLYVDGISRATATVTGGGVPDAADFIDVASDGVNANDPGNNIAVDHFRVANRALTQAEIQASMAVSA